MTFSDEEKVFVKKTNELETTEDVLVLAEEIYKWMEENAVEDEDEKSVGKDGEDNDPVMLVRLKNLLVVLLKMVTVKPKLQ